MENQLQTPEVGEGGERVLLVASPLPLSRCCSVSCNWQESGLIILTGALRGAVVSVWGRGGLTQAEASQWDLSKGPLQDKASGILCKFPILLKRMGVSTKLFYL